jgi:hypothetical protein
MSSGNLSKLKQDLGILVDEIENPTKNSSAKIIKEGGEQVELEIVYGSTYNVPDCSNPSDWNNLSGEANMCTAEIIAAEMCDKKDDGWEKCNVKKTGSDGSFNAIGVSSAPRKYAVCCEAKDVIQQGITSEYIKATKNLSDYISGYTNTKDGSTCDNDCLYTLINNLSSSGSFTSGCPSDKCILGKESVTKTDGMMDDYKKLLVPCISAHGLFLGIGSHGGAHETSVGKDVDSVCNSYSNLVSNPFKANSLLGGVEDLAKDGAAAASFPVVGAPCVLNTEINVGEDEIDPSTNNSPIRQQYTAAVSPDTGKQQLRFCVDKIKAQTNEATSNPIDYTKGDETCSPTLIKQANMSVLNNQMRTLNMARDPSSGEKDTSFKPVGVKRTPWTANEIQEADQNLYSEHIENIITKQLGYMDNLIPGCGKLPENMSEEQLDTCFGPFKPMNDKQWPILFNKIMADMLGPIITIISIGALIFALLYFICLFNESFRAELMEEGSI